ncbi:MAG: putative rane protein [Herbinix sp.]|jgi:hypothetical protein|nr:putative rane protein [Herbinix sp.]
MDFIRFFLILLVPGIIADRLFRLIGGTRASSNIFTSLIFDLVIFIINITGLYFFRGITTMAALIDSFTCLSFTRNYALLSILIAIILGSIAGAIHRLFFWWRRRA